MLVAMLAIIPVIYWIPTKAEIPMLRPPPEPDLLCPFGYDVVPETPTAPKPSSDGGLTPGHWESECCYGYRLEPGCIAYGRSKWRWVYDPPASPP